MNNKAIIGIAFGIVGITTASYMWFKSSSKKKSSDVPTEKATNSSAINGKESSSKTEPNDITIDNISAQTSGIFINMVNTIRLNELLKKLSEIDCNQEGAREEIEKLRSEVQKILLTNRGGTKGAHGFIGESAQVHIANIKSFIKGEKPLYVLLDDNSMTDYIRGNQLIQQKACRSDGNLGLNHVKRHMDTYPEFLSGNNVYQIPKDFFKIFEKLRNISPEEAMKLRKEELRTWKVIQSLLAEDKSITIEPMEVTYSEIQTRNIDDTISKVEKETEQSFKNQKNKAKAECGPSVNEYIKIVGITSVVEGIAGVAGVCFTKRIHGKKFKDFDKNDRKEILFKFGAGFFKGAIRASFVYALTNFAHWSSSVATTITSLLLNCSTELFRFLKKEVSKIELLKNIAFDILGSVFCAVGAYVGKKVFKKNPLLGSIFGSAIGSYGVNSMKKVIFA